MTENIKCPGKQDIKGNLSALWVFAKLTYTYGAVEKTSKSYKFKIYIL